MAWLRSQRGKFSRMMVNRAALVLPSIEVFQLALLELADQRWRQNLGTLLAAAWVALRGRVPTQDEAAEWVRESAETVAAQREDTERDEGRECLDRLFAHMVRTRCGDYPLWHWVGVVHYGIGQADLGESLVREHEQEARNQLEIFGLRVGDDGLYVRNNSPPIEDAFRNTKWAGNGWRAALRMIEGASALPNAIKWRSGDRQTDRGSKLPLDVIRRPMELTESEAAAAARAERMF